MTAAQPEQFDASEDTPRDFVDLIREYDASDALLLIMYARYLENPTDARYRAINRARTQMIDNFETVLVGLDDDMSNATNDNQRAANIEIAGTLIIDTSKKHDDLLAEYTDEQAMTPEVAQNMRDALVGCLELGEHDALEVGDDDHEAFVAHAMSHLNEVLASDDEAMAQLVDDKLESPGHRMKVAMKRISAEAARIAVASAVALVIVSKFRK